MTSLPDTAPWALTIGILTSLLLATAAGLLWQHYRYRRLRNHYRSVLAEQEKLVAETTRLTGRSATGATFSADLDQAALTTRLQYPRLKDYGSIAERTAPERYRYAHRLSTNGMEAEQIASLLTISEHEARQLVHLSRLSAR
jgi:cell division protein FtsL